jgi:hypothetical protein
MATTTPNFGWSVPTSSDLVKNGALAIETLGDSIDSSLVDLKGGTTGQVLAKATGTDMDFTWTTVGSGALTLIKRASFSNVATTTTTFDSVFTTTYANYLVVIDTIYAATTADDLQMQMRYSATTESGANYFGSTFGSVYTGSTTNSGTNALTAFTISTASGSSTYAGSGLMYFNRVGNGSQIPQWNGQFSDFSSSGAPFFFGGQTQTSRTYDGFLLKSASTNITGTVSVYGLAK